MATELTIVPKWKKDHFNKKRICKSDHFLKRYHEKKKFFVEKSEEKKVLWRKLDGFVKKIASRTSQTPPFVYLY